MTNGILAITLIISLITDIRNRKILNIVTFPAMVIGLIYYSITQGLEGFLFSIMGLLVGFVLLLIPYLLGGMGAGDVKLMAAIGALTGVSFVIHSFFYTALMGGIIAWGVIAKNTGDWGLFKFIKKTNNPLKDNETLNIEKQKVESSTTYPYGIPIALGALCAFLMGGI